MVMKTSVVCPHCKHAMDRVSEAGIDIGRKPVEGAYTMCIRCGELAVFDGQGILREPTVDEYIEAGRNEQLGDMRKAWMALQELKASDLPRGGITKDNLLDAAFENIQDGIEQMGNAPPNAVRIMKTIFALGAKSVLSMIEAAEDDEHAAMMLKCYENDLTAYMVEGAKRVMRRKQ